MTDDKTKVVIKGPGVEVTRDLSEAQVLAVLRIVLGDEQAMTEPEPGPLKGPGSPRRPPKSIAEFFREAQPKRNPDKIVTIASYLQSRLGQETFSPDELKPQFKNSGESPPANFARDFNWAVKNGWLAADPTDPSRYYVTSSGQAAVEKSFPEEVTRATGIESGARRKGGRRRRTTKKGKTAARTSGE